MRITRTLGFAGALILSALVGGTLIGSAFATEDTDDAETSGRGEYCEVFMDALAGELSVDRDGLIAAGRSAANTALDAAVAAGDLDAEHADALRTRIAESDGTGCAWIGKGFAAGFDRDFNRGAAKGFLGGNVYEAAADALDIESSELIGQLRDAGSLEALSEDLSATYADVTASVLAAVQADLDAAVAEGMDEEHADTVIERLTNWLDGGGEARGFGRGHGFPGRGHGPWGDRGGDDPESEESGS